MKRVPSHNLIENHPDDAEGPERRPETEPPANRVPGLPSGDVQSSSGKAGAPRPQAAHPYRAVFVCASRPPEHSGSET